MEEDDHAERLWRELVDGSVECELCNEPYDESDDHLPRLLSCGHTFCQSCLYDWSNAGMSSAYGTRNDGLMTMECPTCRQCTSFSAADGPRALPKNFELLRVRHEIEAQTHQHLYQLKQVWTTQVMEKEKSAREAEENAMIAQRESNEAAQRAMHLAKQVEINEQEKRRAQEIAEDARRRALAASQQAEALQAETELLKQRLHQEAQQLQRVKKDARSAIAEAAEMQSKAHLLEQQVEAVRAQLSLHAGRHDPSKLVVLVVEPTTVGSWLMPYTRYAVISIAKSSSSGQDASSPATIDPYHAAKTWVKMRHVAEPSSSVKVYRRYSDFVWLHHELHRQFPFECVPSIPGKQLFFNKDKEFVGERMRSLQAFLREILRHPVLATTEYVRAFLLSTTEELENLRNVARLNDDEDMSFLREVEASEVSATTSGPSSRSSITSPTTSQTTAAVTPAQPPTTRSSWAWGAVSALTSSAAKLVTSTGSALSSGIAGVSTTAAAAATTSYSADDVSEKPLSSSLTITDEDTANLTTNERQAIEKRKKFIEIARAHQSVTQKGAHVSRVQRQYAHHLHRLCELMHQMDTLDRNYAKHKHERHLLAVSMMDHSNTYTARQVEEDARACLESERPFQEKASEVFSSLSLATTNDAECMEYALLEISRMQTLHLGAIEDAFSRLRTKEEKLQQHTAAGANSGRSSRHGSFSSSSLEQQPYGSSGSSPSLSTSSHLLLLAKKDELAGKRHELLDKVLHVDPSRAKFVFETLQQNVKEMHALAVARRKLHESSYQQLVAACRDRSV